MQLTSKLENPNHSESKHIHTVNTVVKASNATEPEVLLVDDISPDNQIALHIKCSPHL